MTPILLLISIIIHGLAAYGIKLYIKERTDPMTSFETLVMGAGYYLFLALTLFFLIWMRAEVGWKTLVLCIAFIAVLYHSRMYEIKTAHKGQMTFTRTRLGPEIKEGLVVEIVPFLFSYVMWDATKQQVSIGDNESDRFIISTRPGDAPEEEKMKPEPPKKRKFGSKRSEDRAAAERAALQKNLLDLYNKRLLDAYTRMAIKVELGYRIHNKNILDTEFSAAEKTLVGIVISDVRDIGATMTGLEISNSKDQLAKTLEKRLRGEIRDPRETNSFEALQQWGIEVLWVKVRDAVPADKAVLDALQAKITELGQAQGEEIQNNAAFDRLKKLMTLSPDLTVEAVMTYDLANNNKGGQMIAAGGAGGLLTGALAALNRRRED